MGGPVADTFQVESLWRDRHLILQPKKRRRLEWFFEVFPPVMEAASKQHEFSPDEVRQSPYFAYLRHDYRSWQREPMTERAERQVRHRFYDGVRLLEDIRERGMIDPLEAVKWNAGKRGFYLMLGYRRFVILHTLGIETAETLTHRDYDAYLAWGPGR